ncbi:MAG: PDZ domain-containing protein [Flavobacteriales bacterium]|nr:PDZ domain-containing protein [Flavobacteriales bacterium]MDG2086634.1 PDZ domain-containing protein [Flavobacteriales bacterium]
MINYHISFKKPYRHFVDFEFSAKTNGANSMKFQLSSWRPGRYELADFAQNIQKWGAFDEKNNPLPFKKITKDLWEVNTNNAREVIIVYNFYANQLDAGACYLDEHQLYLNPVHCMFYIVDRSQEVYQLNLDLPNDYKVASSMHQEKNTLTVKGYDLLAESPIICSNSLQHTDYKVNGITFHIWFQGICNPNWEKLKKDFTAFTKSQIKHFGSFPVDEYHFFFQITPYGSYHGVEHTKNTVLLLGPGDEIMNKRYEDLLGICSHELYHTWNIKAIRPIEMYPYNYTKENYFRTGFVAEGVTTYMGDIMLFNSNVFDWNQFVKTQNQNLERHLMNYGRYNLSVADSGFDTWLDGYKLGSPNRKTSIYPDAALCMLMIDLEIIRNSNGKYSLHSVMKELYEEFALKEKGYNEDDFRNICVKFGGLKVAEIFENHIYGTEDYIDNLKSALNVVGLLLEDKKNPNLSAQYFGFVSAKENGEIIIKKVEPNSITDQNRIAPDDKIIKINDKKIDGNLSDILKDCKKEVTLTIKKKFSQKSISLSVGNYYQLLEIIKNKNATDEQLTLRKVWCNN